MKIAILPCTIACVLSASLAFGQNGVVPPPAVTTAGAGSAGKLADDAAPPTIDGVVDDAIWQSVAPFTSFTQQDPREGEPATEKTEVRLLVSKTHVYVSFICFDGDPSSIIVSQGRRDASLTDTDSVVMVLDTFNDNQNAFVFGTNPLGIEYDGQVAREGQTSGIAAQGSGGGGVARGGISAFNPNWDGDWVVRATTTARGWEAEMAIPLKTLRYATGPDKTWGFNVLRNIRHKNEQVYLAPIPRGFDIYRVSLATKQTGLVMPQRRDIKVIPYVLGSSNKDFSRATDRVDNKFAIGGDLKWGIRPNLTLDATINTDFAQVEVDEEQVNLTRFDLFFPEKRPFFLENASTFQFGQPQQVDIFFSRRIGLSSTGVPIDILGGARLSGKVGAWNIGMLNVQTDEANDSLGQPMAPANNFAVARAQRDVGRSSYGAIFVNRQATGSRAGSDNWNRAFGVDANWQATTNQRISTYLARTESPGDVGGDNAGRLFYNFTNNIWQVAGGYSEVGEQFNPEVGFLPRRGYRRPEMRVFFQPQPKGIPWIRRIAPHVSYSAFHDLDGELQTSMAHIHPFEIQPRKGGRFGWFFDHNRDNPLLPFTVYNRDGKRVAIPAGKYEWVQHAFEYQHDPSAPLSFTSRYRIGDFYDGDFNALELTGTLRVGTKFNASGGWTRQDIKLPQGEFVTNLVPVLATYAFTPLASLQTLVQYNGQTANFSANVRLALLNRSGTGLFVVYNDRRDTTSFTPAETLGRSFVIKFTRLFDM